MSKIFLEGANQNRNQRSETEFWHLNFPIVTQAPPPKASLYSATDTLGTRPIHWDIPLVRH